MENMVSGHVIRLVGAWQVQVLTMQTRLVTKKPHDTIRTRTIYVVDYVYTSTNYLNALQI